MREARLAGVAAILDLVSQAPDASLLAEGGRLASPLGAAGRGCRTVQPHGRASPANLERLGGLLAAGTLRVPIQRSYLLERAGEALEALPTTHTRGKLGVTIA